MMNGMAARGESQGQYPGTVGLVTEPEPALPAVPPEDPAGCGEQFASPEELELSLFGQLIDPLNDEVRLSAGPYSSARARRLTLSALESWGLGGHGEVAEQLVAELIANAVRHTGGRTFGLRLVRRQGCVRFEVRDPSRALPCLILGEPDDEGGRGLQLVNTLAQRWGADLLSHGKAVWFELRVREAGQ
jgi:signal transduction histidine kinase